MTNAQWLWWLSRQPASLKTRNSISSFGKQSIKRSRLSTRVSPWCPCPSGPQPWLQHDVGGALPPASQHLHHHPGREPLHPHAQPLVLLLHVQVWPHLWPLHMLFVAAVGFRPDPSKKFVPDAWPAGSGGRWCTCRRAHSRENFHDSKSQQTSSFLLHRHRRQRRRQKFGYTEVACLVPKDLWRLWCSRWFGSVIFFNRLFWTEQGRSWAFSA